MKLYIRERKIDNWVGSRPVVSELAYYGPFDQSEIDIRLNDAFADSMAEGGAEIEAVLLSMAEASNMYINPREFWMSQLETLEFISGKAPDDLGTCEVCQCPLTRNGCENVSQHHFILAHL